MANASGSCFQINMITLSLNLVIGKKVASRDVTDGSWSGHVTH